VPQTMRVELFYKNPTEAITTISLLQQSHPYAIHGYNLPNKVPKDPVLENAAAVLDKFPEADLCVHYSLKYNSERRGDDTVDKFKRFLDACTFPKVLLVSGGAGGGGKPKKAMNCVTCLQQLRKDGYSLPSRVKLGVAYNPYYPTHQDEEFRRLREKLDTGYVSHIWLNMGSDTDALKTALDAITALNIDEKGIRLIGSLFVPSKALLAKFKFRMWAGLYLSDEYLGSVQGAMRVTGEIMDLYERYQVEPLIESAIRTEKDVQLFTELISSRSPRYFE
jgi:hypothetical protein